MVRKPFVALLALSCAAACDQPPPGGEAPEAVESSQQALSLLPTPRREEGVMNELVWLARKAEYLRFATKTFNPHSVTNVLAHLEMGRTLPFLRPRAAGTVPLTAWDAQLERMATLRDLRDFDALSLVQVIINHRTDPMLAPGLADKVERALLNFKYWYTEPTAPGLRDESYYWSENHAVTYHTAELLLGELRPDAVFGNDGRAGALHAAHARARLLRWMDLRARYGFSEWHSNVYYQKDMVALLALADLAHDEDIRVRATALLDTLLFDLALHTQRGVFGSTHGRSYKLDVTSGQDEATWHIGRLLLHREGEFTSPEDAGAVAFARSQSYRLPDAIALVADSEESFVDRERMGIPIDETGPVRPNVGAPVGMSYDTDDDVSVWWSMGAFAAWPVVPLTLRTMETYGVWDNPFFAPYRALRALGANPRYAQLFAAQTYALLDRHTLAQVNTYTYRSRGVMLSTAVDYRPGASSVQAQAWQATLDAKAVVFTTHPFTPPAASTTWRDDNGTGGYFTGQASFPRSAQHETVAVHIYNPAYPAKNAPPLDALGYLPYTHAYFPQDHFDEVVQDGAWTFGRRGAGYVALYSFRPAKFRSYDPAVVATNGMTRPFDLVAEGGADNVWIVEVGDMKRFRSFAAFRKAVAQSAVAVTPRPPTRPGLTAGFDVVYASPSQGEVRFGWTGALTVAGAVIPTSGFPRYDNPWSSTAFGSQQVKIEAARREVTLDFAAGARTTDVERGCARP